MWLGGDVGVVMQSWLNICYSLHLKWPTAFLFTKASGSWFRCPFLWKLMFFRHQSDAWEMKNTAALPRDTCKSVPMFLGSLWRVLCPEGCPSAGAVTRWEDDCQAAITAAKPNGDRSILLGLIQDLCCISGTKWILQWMEMYGKRGSKMKNIFIAVGYMLVSFKRIFFF